LTGAGVVSFNGRFGTVNPAEGDYTLTQLGDVIITSPSNGQVLKYNGSNWVNATEVSEADTLDTVTGRGNTTANSITVGSVTAAGLSNLLGQIRTFVTTGNIYMGANPGSATDAGFKLDVLGTTRLNGNTTVTGVLTGSDTIRSTNGTVTVSISYGSTAGIIGTTSNHSLEIRTNNTYRVGVSTAGVVNIANLIGTGSRIVVADSAGNLSATTAIGDFVTINTTQTITGAKTFNNLTTFNQNIVGGIIKLSQGVLLSKSAAVGTDAGYLSLIATSATGLNYINIADGDAPSNTQRFAIPNTGTYTYTLPGASGTLALTSDIPSVAGVYLPLSGGTLTGALNGTSASFSSNFYVSGGTNTNVGNGIHAYYESNYAQIQLNGDSAAGSLIDFSTSGTDYKGRIVYRNATNQFEFNTNGNGTPVLTLASGGAATFSSTVTTGGDVTIPNGSYYYAKRQSGGASINVLGFASGSDTLIIKGGTSGSGVSIQFQDTGGNIAAFNNGNFGINTTNPNGRLHVETSSGSTLLRLSASAVNTKYLYTLTGGADDAFTLSRDHTSAGGLDIMTWTYSGKVGIGTTSPTELFHLYTAFAGSSGVGTIMKFESAGAGGDQAWIGVNKGTGNGLTFSVENRDIIFRTGATTAFGGSEKLRITSGGDIIVNYSVANDSGSRVINIQGSRSATNVDISSLYLTQIWNGTAYPVILAAQQDLSYGNASGIFVLKTSYWNGSSVSTGERLRVTAEGNLLVNTTSNSGFKVDVNGTGRFTGDVKVKTLEVTNVGTDATSSGVSTYMRITVNGQNYLIPLHGTP
jgi:hypothetical protein